MKISIRSSSGGDTLVVFKLSLEGKDCMYRILVSFDDLDVEKIICEDGGMNFDLNF